MRHVLALMILVAGCAADAAMPRPNCEAPFARCCVETGMPAPDDIACDGVPVCSSGVASCAEDPSVRAALTACQDDCAGDSACRNACLDVYARDIQRAECSDGSTPTC